MSTEAYRGMRLEREREERLDTRDHYYLRIRRQAGTIKELQEKTREQEATIFELRASIRRLRKRLERRKNLDPEL